MSGLEPSGKRAETGTPQEIETRLQYWTGVEELIKLRNGPNPAKPSYRHWWLDHGMGKPHVTIRLAAAHTRYKRLRVYLYLNAKDGLSQVWFDLLAPNRDEIEKAIGASLIWDKVPFPQRRCAHVSLILDDADPLDKNDWPRQHHWLADMAERFYNTFQPFIMELPEDDTISAAARRFGK